MENGFHIFKKEIPDNPIFLPTGQKVDFEIANPNDYGFIRTDNTFIISELTKATQRRIGGVVPSNDAEYQEFLKKKQDWPSGRPSPRDRESVSAKTFNRFRAQRRPIPAVVAPAVVAGNRVQHPTPEPLEVPVFPTLGLMGKPPGGS